MRKGQTHSEEAKIKIREARRQQISPMSGRLHSAEAKQRMSLSHKLSFIKDPSLRERLSKVALGQRRSPSTEFKKGTRVGILTMFKKGGNMGGANSNWKGGVTSINERIRKSIEYKTWRRHVFIRDDHTCQACGTRGGNLHADHEFPFSLFPQLRFEVLNGRTLCIPCHRKTPTYGDLKAIEKLFA